MKEEGASSASLKYFHESIQMFRVQGTLEDIGPIRHP